MTFGIIFQLVTSAIQTTLTVYIYPGRDFPTLGYSVLWLCSSYAPGRIIRHRCPVGDIGFTHLLSTHIL